MRDNSHLEQIERWARFFSKNRVKARKELNLFLDSQIKKANEFLKRLERERGRKFVLALRGIN